MSKLWLPNSEQEKPNPTPQVPQEAFERYQFELPEEENIEKAKKLEQLLISELGDNSANWLALINTPTMLTWLNRWMEGIIPSISLEVVKKDRNVIFNALREAIEDINLRFKVENKDPVFDTREVQKFTDLLVRLMQQLQPPILKLAINMDLDRANRESGSSKKQEEGGN
jgi:hypothetical protein